MRAGAANDRIRSPAFVSPRYVRRGVEPEGTERVRVSGRDASLVVWSPHYDGKGQGTDAIAGGSRVER